jgi:hypothetical protein
MYTTRYSCQILMKFGLSWQILEIHSYQILWKSLRWGPSCSEEEGADKPTDWLTDLLTDWLTDRLIDWLTDIAKLIAFRNFAKAPKKKEGIHEVVL